MRETAREGEREREAAREGEASARRLLATLGVVALLVLAGCAGVGGRASTDAAGAQIAFENATASSGLQYSDRVAGGVGNGNAGVYALDYDRDGWTDLLTIGGERPALFENANGTFRRQSLPRVDVTVKSAVVVDYDGDADPDVVLFGENGSARALRNDDGTFVRDDVGLGGLDYPLGAAAADFDGDGDTDLFVYQSGDWADGKPAGYTSVNGTITEDNGHPNVLFENVGGRFVRANETGIEGARWSLAASAVDLNGDGRPDVHVANDYNSDVVYLNAGNGTFVRHRLGGATARNGMASEIADFDGDGTPDVFVTNIELPISPGTVGKERYELMKRIFTYVIHSDRTEGNTLLVNRGNGTFVDRADAYGVRVGGWGWAASAVDFDDDGRRDLVTTTQKVVRIDRDHPKYTLPMLWRNNGSGFTNLNASARGLAEHDGRGLVTLDYDHDGRRDLVTATYGGPVVVYRNVGGDGHHGLDVRVVDADGTTALGATVTVEAGGRTMRLRTHSRTDYLSQEPRTRHVGLGDATTATLTVRWPDGTERTVEVDADRRVRVSPAGVTTVATYDRGDGA